MGKSQGHLGKTGGDKGLTTLATVIIVTSTKEKDSPTIDREGGVEDQSNNDLTDFDPALNRTMAIEQRPAENGYECSRCVKTFGTLHGLRIHQGKTCMKKSKQCSSSERKTRSKSSQEQNHSGLITASATTSVMQELREQEIAPQVEGARKPRVLWPAANEKAKYKILEEKVCEKIKHKNLDEGTVHEALIQLETTTYDTGIEEFGPQEGRRKQPEKAVVGGKSRREKKLAEIRKQKKELRKKWKAAPEEEKEGYLALYEDLKKNSRDVQRQDRRRIRRRESKQTRERFLKNPVDVTKKMFTEARSGSLKCTKQELDDHLRQTYSDPKRNEPLPHMEGLKHPTEPGVAFNLGDLQEKEVDDFVKKARAKSAPGGDGVSYKVYKYCEKLRRILFRMLQDLWEKRELVEEWCTAEGVYLPKEENAEQINQFRPISVLGVAGKIYMGILAKRTVMYLQSNGYVDESVQKAGIPGIPGCVEHAFSIWEEIQDAKKNKNDLNVVWLDLANAYGSVPHGLLLKAMDFFYIPEDVKMLMKKYFDCFRMRFTTENFTSEWHRLEIGIAAGCTISVIWFILVMEMLLRSADCSEEKAMVKAPKKAFMDDVTLLTRDTGAMKDVLTRLDALVTWSRMRFKAKKSRSLTFTKGVQKQQKFKIGGDTMPTVKEEPVKSLGRWYAGTLSDKSRGIAVMNQTEEGLKAIDRSKLPGKYKIWCLQFGLYPRIGWPLMMYEIALSRVEIIEQKCNTYIRKWLGLPRVTNTSALYRKNGALQLPLTSIVEVYKAGKVRTVMMLRESKDEEVRSNPPDVRTARKWKAEEETDNIVSALEHRDIVGAGQCDKKGIGYNPFKPFTQMKPQDRRKAATGLVVTMEAERRDLHLIQCASQGQVTRWEEGIVERKIGWNEIWQWNTSRLSFLIRSTYDVLPSPANLVKWKIAEDDKCRCGHTPGTMKHTLSNCRLALNRYTWRHNEVLKVLHETAKQQVDAHAYETQRLEPTRTKIAFVAQGTQVRLKERDAPRPERTLGEAWEVTADLPGCEGLFPVPTTKRPDMVVWCEQERKVHIVELTVPHEDNIAAAHERKEARYEKLLDECAEAGWQAQHFPIEVGCRGFVGESVRGWLRTCGLKSKDTNNVLRRVQETVEKASHWIWLKRDDDSWLEKTS